MRSFKIMAHTIVLSGLALLWAGANVTAGDLDIKEPEKAETVTPRKPERARWSWNKPEADFTTTGDLAWKPEPHKFEAGSAARFIDFERRQR